MKKLFTQKLLMLVLSVFVLSACDDDEKSGTTGEFKIGSETTSIAAGIFSYDTTPEEDDEENTYYTNQVIFLGKGLGTVTSGDEYEITGEGNLFELWVNNSEQELEEGTYTWRSDEDEQAFDLIGGGLTLNVNTANEVEYAIDSGTLTVTKSGSVYKMEFNGTAYVVSFPARGIPSVAVSATFEGKFKTFAFNF